MSRRAAVATIVCAVLHGCAYVGEPLPPALKIPESVTDLSAIQRGDKIVVSYSEPKLTTEGLGIAQLGTPDLRVGETPVPRTFDAAPYVGQNIELRVRYVNDKGRAAEWSNSFRMDVVAPVAVPDRAIAKATPGGAEVSWSGDAPAVRIFRDGELLATAKASPYVDAAVERGKSYRYRLQAVKPAGDREAESEVSMEVAIEIVDRFPPAPPARLSAAAGVNSVELLWERNIESDFAFYRVYRDGRIIADKLVAVSFSDRQVRSGERYVYAVTAIDRDGNESARTAPVEMFFP